MPDVMEIPNRYRRAINRQLIELKELESWRGMAWFAICELIYLHRKGK